MGIKECRENGIVSCWVRNFSVGCQGGETVLQVWLENNADACPITATDAAIDTAIESFLSYAEELTLHGVSDIYARVYKEIIAGKNHTEVCLCPHQDR